MSLFDQLARKQRKTSFYSSPQMMMFNDNRVLLDQVPLFSRFMKATEPFDIIRANIIIQSILNKKAIEEAYSEQKKEKKNSKKKESEEYMNGVLETLNYMPLEDEKIFIPIFPISLNRIYSKDYEKLSKPPYEALLHNYEAVVVDPFDTYGSDIYNTYFTKLVLIKKTELGAAYYDYDSDAIYFVNHQGRLDGKLCLFDKYLYHPNYNHIIKRIAPVVDAYYRDSKEDVERLLVENKLVSSKLILKIKSDEAHKYSLIYGDNH